MADLFTRLEINDENGQYFAVVPDRGENKGFLWQGERYNKSYLSYWLRNTGAIKKRIVKGKQVRGYIDCIDPRGLVGVWHFDGNAKDDGPPKGRNNGTITGAAWSSIDDEIALDYNGTTTYVEAPDGSLYNFENSWSFRCKIKFDTLGGVHAIFGKGNNVSWASGSKYINCFSNLIHFEANGLSVIDGTTVLSVNTEYDLCVTYNSSTTTLKIYLDATQDVSATITIPADAASNFVRFGQLHNGEFLNGKAKHAAFYTVELTADEVSDLHEGKAVSRGLYSLWRFDEGTGTTAYDSVTIKHDGTLVNSPSYVTAQHGEGLQLVRASTQYVDVTDHATLDFGTKMTIDFFIKFSSLPGADMVIAGKYGAAGNCSWVIYYRYASNNIRFAVSTDGINITEANGATAISAGVLYHITGTYDGANIRILINAAQDALQAKTGGIFVSTAKLQFGYVDGYPNALNATYLDELRLYERVLTDAEISTIGTSYIQHKRIFTGVNTDIAGIGTYNETLEVFCRDFFKDLQLSDDINKKYPSQEVATTVTDIINLINAKRSAGLLTTGIQTLGISQPYNCVSENFGHLCERITGSTISELFMRSHNKEVVLRPLGTVDSGAVFTDGMILDPETVNVQTGIADSYETVRVVGGLSTDAYDLGKRVMVEVNVPGAASTIKGRVYNVVDERFTTFAGAKMHALSLANDLGAEFYGFGSPLKIKNLTKWAEPGEFVAIDSDELDIASVKFLVERIKLRQNEGEKTVRFVEFTIGNTEQGEVEAIRILQSVQESEKRKLIDVDADTDEKFFSVALQDKYEVIVTITKRNPSTDPYLEGNGSDRATDAHESFSTFDDGA